MTDKNPLPRIEVVQYQGRSGGFSHVDRTMWRPELVGVGGCRNLTSWMCEGGGYTQKKFADETARSWANLLGCPVFDVEEIRTVTAQKTEIVRRVTP